MSARKKKEPQSPGDDPGRPSASPADKTQRAKLREEDWNFSQLLNAYRKAKRKADSAAGRELTAAAIYEYAREAEWFREVCQDLADVESKLAKKFGKDWDEPDLEGWQEKRVGAPSPIHPALFDSLREEWEGLVKKFGALEERMGAGCVLLRTLHASLAADIPWLLIPQEDRQNLLARAWTEDDPPRWIAVIEEVVPEGRMMRRGEHPPLPACCGPAHPREMFHLAHQDHENDLRWRKREPEGRVTQGEWSDHVNKENQDKLSGRGLRDCNPTGQETMAFRLNWSLTDDQMEMEFRKMLKLWRPDVWKEFATVRERNVAVGNALIELSAFRYERKVRASNEPDNTRAKFWSTYPKRGGPRSRGSEESLFSGAVANAKLRLVAWGLCRAF